MIWTYQLPIRLRYLMIIMRQSVDLQVKLSDDTY